MAMIQITPELLQSKAAEVRSLKSNHDDTMQKLNNLIHALNDQFKGEAHDAFVAKFDSMQSSFKNFSEMLEEYAKMMDTAAREFETVDTTLKSSFS